MNRSRIISCDIFEVAYKFNPVIPYSEVTNEIGNLLSARCSVIVFVDFVAYFTGIFNAQWRGE